MAGAVAPDARARGYGVGITDLDETVHPPIEGQPQLTRHARADRTITDSDIRCTNEVEVPRSGRTKVCGRLLAITAGRPWTIQCPRCHAVNQSPGPAPSSPTL